MDDAPGGYVLQGSVSFEAVEYTLEAQRLPLFTRTAPSPWIGAYTLAMSAPDAVDVSLMPGGDGYGTLAVTATGSCTGTITLPDGTRATLGGHIGSAYDVAGTDVAAWSFHRGLYGRTPRGFLAGKLNFRDLAGTSDVDGLWHWVKQTGAAPTTVYPDGFDDQRQVIGSRYTPPAVNTRAMTGLAATTDNVWLRFDGADLSSLLDLTLNTKNLTGTWQQNNAILHYGPQTVRLTFAPRTGALTGTYLDTANGINFAFGGVLIQDQNLLTGSYLTRGQSGLFVIQPR
jgi:hypothetical protein